MMQSEATTSTLHELGYKIFLDRYAQKDMTRSSLSVGDTVIVVVNAKTGQREIGTVSALDLPQVTVALLDGETVVRDLEHVDKPIETGTGADDDARGARVAVTEGGQQKQAEWSEKFRWLLDDWKFVPGGAHPDRRRHRSRPDLLQLLRHSLTARLARRDNDNADAND